MSHQHSHPSTSSSSSYSHSSTHASHSHDGPPFHSHDSSYDHSSSPPSPDPSISDALLEAEHFIDVIYHFEMYAEHSLAKLHRLTSDFQSIDPALQRLVPSFLPRMAELRAGILLNFSFLRTVTAHRFAFQSDPTLNYALLEERRLQRGGVDEEKMGKVRSTLRQCVRDWSKEGEKERAACYSPMLKELERLHPPSSSRASVRVLVPGSGLGRLVWEVAAAGFFAQGNEFSYFMLVASYLILNESRGVGQWSIHPYVHDSKNVMKGEDMLRRVSIPDVDVSAGVGECGGRFSMVAGDFMDVYSEEGRAYREKEKEMKQSSTKAAHTHMHEHDSSAPQHPTVAAHHAASPPASSSHAAQPASASLAAASSDSDSDSDSDGDASTPPSPSSTLHQQGSWDAVLSCYFLDCSNNVLETLRTISYLLKPGGHWLHFGPLLYHYSDMPHELSVELTYEELKQALPAFGLKVVQEKSNRQSGYCVDERSMQRGYFYCTELTCIKVGGDTTRGEESGVQRKKTRRGKGKKARSKQEKRQQRMDEGKRAGAGGGGGGGGGAPGDVAHAD